MMRKMLPFVLAAAATLSPLSALAEGKLTLKSVSVDLPTSDRLFPAGPGSDAVNSTCLACHSAAMVLDQPTLSKAQWHAEVEKMITTYKAPIDPADVDAIVGYLVSIRGAK